MLTNENWSLLVTCPAMNIMIKFTISNVKRAIRYSVYESEMMRGKHKMSRGKYKMSRGNIKCLEEKYNEVIMFEKKLVSLD